MSTNLQSNYDKSAAYLPLRAIPARPIVRGETDMMEIFLIQLLAAGLGALSTAWADWSYNRARIGTRLHALWVATSIGVICLPVVSWTSMVFLGSGPRPIRRRHTCRCGISLGVSKPAEAPPSPQIWTGVPRRPRSGAIPPGIQARWVNRKSGAVRFRISGCPLQRHARLSKGLASPGGRSSCLLRRAPRRD